jgi:hypothetical protein
MLALRALNALLSAWVSSGRPVFTGFILCPGTAGRPRLSGTSNRRRCRMWLPMAQLLIVADDVAARGDTDVEEVETGSMGMLA